MGQDYAGRKDTLIWPIWYAGIDYPLEKVTWESESNSPDNEVIQHHLAKDELAEDEPKMLETFTRQMATCMTLGLGAT